jgi:serine phosphatase RsbU (regulator of sigma subunit)
MKKLFERGYLPGDSEEDKLKKSSLLLMAIPFSFAGIIWGALYFANGLYLPGWIPFSYGILSFLSVVHFLLFRKFRFFRFSQILLILLLPFFLQLSLGGFIPGSAVILWAILSPLGALAFYNIRYSLFWFAAFMLLLLVAYALDDKLAAPGPAVSGAFVLRLMLLNLMSISAFIYLLQYHFVGKQQALKKAVDEKNAEIGQKNKEITDSINYARRIQYALLAHESLLAAALPEFFIFFKPKDIVSGDFYWATRSRDGLYLAVCDSTGHGVPGAFMSLLNISLLNEAINEKQLAEPGAVCDYVRNKLIEYISQEGGQDGMDGALLHFNTKDETVRYAAAHNAPLLVSGGQAVELPADKMPIGRGESNARFSTHLVPARRGDMLYFFTDGYADQFGGPKGKKFKYGQLKQLLVDLAGKPLAEQQRALEETFESWKGSLEQTDDVLVIGVRV